MADTGFVTPLNMVGNRGITGGSQAWNNPDNAKVDDTSTADTTLIAANPNSLGLESGDFGMSALIPLGARIDGIEIQVGDYDTDGVAADWTSCRLVLADNSDGTEDKSGDLVDPDSTVRTNTVGGPNDTWGEALTLANVQDVDFGFFIGASRVSSDAVVRVDFVRMKVFFTPLSDTGIILPGTVDGARGAGEVWVNPDNIKADDANEATVVVTSGSPNSRGIAATNFSFAALIPVGSIISGIKLRVGDYFTSDADTLAWLACRLILADNSDGTETKHDDIDGPTQTPTGDSPGGPTDLWMETITREDVVDVDFGCFVSVTYGTGVGPEVNLDFLGMQVFFTPPRKYMRRHIGFA